MSVTAAARAAAKASTAAAPKVAPKPVDTKALVKTIKAAFEKSSKKQLPTIFEGERKASSHALKGDALRAYKEYAHTTRQGMINDGPPEIRVATVQGQKIFFVKGDVSDTGTNYGFYTQEGKLLASAYSGQGMNPNRAGVDWNL